MEWIDYKNRKVFVQVETTNGIRVYSGIINDVVYMGKNTDKIDIYFLELIDKFSRKIGFPNSSIKLIKEEL